MKDKSKKHDHKGTKILKLSIFASVMLAPLFAIGFKCAYATFNKNANQSYSSVQSPNTYLSTDTINDLKKDYIYQFNTNNDLIVNNVNTQVRVSQLVMIKGNNYTGANKEIYRFNYYQNQNGKFIHIEYSNPTVHDYIPFADANGNITQQVQFNFVPYSDVTNPYVSNTNMVIFGVQQSLDNAFYYAVDQMKDNSLFAWTKNTALYTPINAMTSGLGITTDAIAVLLAYWLYITLIYVVFDIVIELFTYLSHLIMGNPIG